MSNDHAREVSEKIFEKFEAKLSNLRDRPEFLKQLVALYENYSVRMKESDLAFFTEYFKIVMKVI